MQNTHPERHFLYSSIQNPGERGRRLQGPEETGGGGGGDADGEPVHRVPHAAGLLRPEARRHRPPERRQQRGRPERDTNRARLGPQDHQHRPQQPSST